MIRKLTLKRFKRFDDVTIALPGNIVLAGPNNTGKTTVLQAIAAWSLAVDIWKRRKDFAKHKGAYARAPIARQAFSAVPLRTFDLLWRERGYSRNAPIEIGIESRAGWTITMEFIADSTEQIYVRPRSDADADILRTGEIKSVYVPGMTGLSPNEPVYEPDYIAVVLGQARPGEVLRNVLMNAHRGERWGDLQQSIRQLFAYELLPPERDGGYIRAEYQTSAAAQPLDIASAGSGFQQVLMLLAFLYTRPASVLLLDEPDAHLHVILQDAIYGELRRVALKQNAQLIIATHSEVIIDTVDPLEICACLDKPKPLAENEDKARLLRSLKVLDNNDIMQALSVSGALYTEDYTDLDILHAWAKVLNHPVRQALKTKILWKPMLWQPRDGASGVKAKDHYDALSLIRNDLPGLELIDGDAHPDVQSRPVTGTGLQRLRWTRYEIESYLVQPTAIARYVANTLGEENATAALEDLRRHFEDTYPPAFIKDPMTNIPYLLNTKARKDLIPPALSAAGIYGVPYTSYSEIAALMKPEEIHPEVKEKLDLIQKAFNL